MDNAFVKALVGTAVPHKLYPGESTVVVDAWMDEERTIMVAVPCHYCGVRQERRYYALKTRWACCPTCNRKLAVQSMRNTGKKNASTMVPESVVGTTIHPACGGRPSKILGWKHRERPEKNHRKGERVYIVACLECGVQLRKNLSQIREREVLCRPCASSIYTAQRAAAKRAALAEKSKAEAQALVGTSILPRFGVQKRAVITGWVLVAQNILYNTACVDCGEPIIMSLAKIKQRTVFCQACSVKPCNKATPRRKKACKAQNNVIAFMPQDRPVETNTPWKNHDEEEYQKKLAELNAMYKTASK